MKWDKLRKLKRNELLVKYRNDNPEASYQDIGEAFGITRERAFQIVKRANEIEGLKDG